MDEIRNGRGNRRTEGAAWKRKTAGQRLRGQNLEQKRAECILSSLYLQKLTQLELGERRGGRGIDGRGITRGPLVTHMGTGLS